MIDDDYSNDNYEIALSSAPTPKQPQKVSLLGKKPLVTLKVIGGQQQTKSKETLPSQNAYHLDDDYEDDD